MLYLKGCPRCHGDMHTNRDMYGEYKECLQCGLIVDLEQPQTISVPAETAVRTRKRQAA